MEQKEYRLAAVVFTDIVGFSRMMEQDETGTLAIVSEHNRLITDLTVAHGGTVIKTVGDAFLLDFSNTVNAVKCALAILDAIDVMSAGPRGQKIRLRVGIHLGDIYFYENDALGEGINIASRLQSQAEPSTICVSQEVYNLVYNKIDESKVLFRDLGEHNLKNISRTLRIYELKPRTIGPMECEDTDGAGAAAGAAAGAGGAAGAGSEDARAASGTSGAADSGATADEDFVVPGAASVHERVMKLLRERGSRPARREVIAALDLISASEIRELDELVARGFVRRDAVDGDSAPHDRASARDDHHHRTGVDFTFGKSRDGDYEETEPGEDSDDDDWGTSQSKVRSDIKIDLPINKLGKILRIRGLDDGEVYEAYREEFRRRMRTERSGLAGHTSSFIGVNAMLIFIWAITGAGFPWPLFPLFGWGIGYLSHRSAAMTREHEFAEVQAMTAPTRRQLKLHRAYWKKRRAHRSGVTSSLATMGLLGMINIVTGVAFPWALIPIGFMTLGMVTGFATHRRERADMEDDLRAAGLIIDPALVSAADTGRGRRERTVGAKATSALDDPSERAKQLRTEIVAQIEALPELSHSLGGDFREVLDRYVEQIETLTTTRKDVNELLASIPVADLDAEQRRLEARIADTADERVAAEYRRNLEQVDRQRRSYSELTSESEMLRLRTTTAVNALTQLKIDVARTRSSSLRAAGDAVEDLRARSVEISEYLQDLRTGYEEID